MHSLVNYNNIQIMIDDCLKFTDISIFISLHADLMQGFDHALNLILAAS